MNRRFHVTLLLALVLSLGCNSQPDAASGTAPTTTGGAHGPTVAVDDGSFEQVVLQSDKPVLVDFWATWCGPCQMIAPIVSELAAEYDGRVVVAKLDTDQAGETAAKYNVEAIPTLIVFHQGREVSRTVGLTSKEDLARQLDAALQ